MPTEDQLQAKFNALPHIKPLVDKALAAQDARDDEAFGAALDEYLPLWEAYLADNPPDPDEPDFHDKWQAMTAEEQDAWINGNELFPPDQFRDGVHIDVADQVGYHDDLYRRAVAVMTPDMWHPDGGNGRVPYHTLTDDAPVAALDIWAEIDRNHSRAMARNVKQNVLNKLRKQAALDEVDKFGGTSSSAPDVQETVVADDSDVTPVSGDTAADDAPEVTRETGRRFVINGIEVTVRRVADGDALVEALGQNKGMSW